tara:strand:- start:624 stop:779 length:156 start_codon:yes stop_codon:yes gene_type:complete
MWHKIMEVSEWFGEMAERYRLEKDFNRAAKHSFIAGVAPTQMQNTGKCIHR